MRTSGLWIHADAPNTVYVAKYLYNNKSNPNDYSDKRALVLILPNTDIKLSFESWQEAKLKGFKKL